MKFRYQRWMIKTSLVYLFLGILIGFLTFLSGRTPELAWISKWRTVHVHLILLGSIIQIIMGVALWMFPRRKEPPGWTTEREGMTLYVGFNAGTVVRSLFEPFGQPGFPLADLPKSSSSIGLEIGNIGANKEEPPFSFRPGQMI